MEFPNTITAAVVLSITAIAHGTTSTLSLKNAVVNVDFVRPYVAFWSAILSLGAAAIGGLAGGLIPRRRIAINAVELSHATTSGFETSANSTSGNRAPSLAAG